MGRKRKCLYSCAASRATQPVGSLLQHIINQSVNNCVPYVDKNTVCECIATGEKWYFHGRHFITRSSAVAKRPCDCCVGQFWQNVTGRQSFADIIGLSSTTVRYCKQRAIDDTAGHRQSHLTITCVHLTNANPWVQAAKFKTL